MHSFLTSPAIGLALQHQSRQVPLPVSRRQFSISSFRTPVAHLEPWSRVSVRVVNSLTAAKLLASRVPTLVPPFQQYFCRTLPGHWPKILSERTLTAEFHRLPNAPLGRPLQYHITRIIYSSIRVNGDDQVRVSLS